MGRKRIHVAHAVYHVTFNTKFRIPYFNEDVFCYILADVIHHATLLKDFFLIASKINPEHIHLLIKCGERCDLSEILHCIKRISAVRINQLITQDTFDRRITLSWTHEMLSFSRAFRKKYGTPSTFPFPLFKWQRGFNDVIMRSPNQLLTAKKYIRNQAAHHDLPEDVHLFLSPKIPEEIVYPALKG